jgi:phosphodiesterase/alkaline phosphatase D-like protein
MTYRGQWTIEFDIFLDFALKTTSLASCILTGSFRTSPSASLSSNKPISFIFTADLGGQKHCRQVHKGGYSIFEKMKEISPDFFIANGDMIYAAHELYILCS